MFKTWPTCRFSMVNHITFIFIKTMSHDLLVQMAYVRLHDIQKKTVSHQEPIIWSKQLPNFAVVDPGEGGGGQSSRLWDKGGPGSKKIWSKNRGTTQVPPLDSPLFCAKVILKIYWLVKMSRQEYIDVAFSGLLSPYGLLFPPKPFLMLIGKMARSNPQNVGC